jgi:hypothetical protein
MARSGALRAALAAAVLLLAAGCSSLGSCSKPGAYANAEQLPPLRMPVGLDGPDTRQAMLIPPLAEPEPPAPTDRCLEEPPEMPKRAATPGAQPAPAAAPQPAPPSRRGRGPRSPRG